MGHVKTTHTEIKHIYTQSINYVRASQRPSKQVYHSLPSIDRPGTCDVTYVAGRLTPTIQQDQFTILENNRKKCRVSVWLLTELIFLSESRKGDYVFTFAKQLQRCELLLQNNIPGATVYK